MRLHVKKYQGSGKGVDASNEKWETLVVVGLGFLATVDSLVLITQLM